MGLLQTATTAITAIAAIFAIISSYIKLRPTSRYMERARFWREEISSSKTTAFTNSLHKEHRIAVAKVYAQSVVPQMQLLWKLASLTICIVFLFTVLVLVKTLWLSPDEQIREMQTVIWVLLLVLVYLIMWIGNSIQTTFLHQHLSFHCAVEGVQSIDKPSSIGYQVKGMLSSAFLAVGASLILFTLTLSSPFPLNKTIPDTGWELAFYIPGLVLIGIGVLVLRTRAELCKKEIVIPASNKGTTHRWLVKSQKHRLENTGIERFRP